MVFSLGVVLLAGRFFPGNFARLAAYIGIFRGDGNLQGAQSIFTGYARSLLRQHGGHEIASLRQVGVGEPRKEMVGENLAASATGKESYGRALQAADENRSLGTDNLGSHVV